MNEVKIGIVGAGMTGLFLAKKLRDKGIDHYIVDKGRGVGGRVANRRFADSAFDTGAQIIRARSAGFRQEMQSLLEANQAILWKKDEEGNPVYFGNGRITNIPKYLLKGSQLFNSWHVENIEFNGNAWRMKNISDEYLQCSHLVITAPTPQLSNILAASSITLDSENKKRLDSVQYRKTLVLIGCLEKIPEKWSNPYYKPDSNTIDTIVNNTTKGVTDLAHSITIHFGREFSENYYDMPESEILESMLKEFDGMDIKWSSTQIKKWGFSEPLKTFGVEAWSPESLQFLYFGGDGFGGGSVEGAWRSSERLIQLLENDLD